MVKVSVRPVGGWLGAGRRSTIFFFKYDFSYKNNYYCEIYLIFNKL
jgi:hypothetical protein